MVEVCAALIQIIEDIAPFAVAVRIVGIRLLRAESPDVVIRPVGSLKKDARQMQTDVTIQIDPVGNILITFRAGNIMTLGRIDKFPVIT